jgi:autotransporter-associated beta strand protein
MKKPPSTARLRFEPLEDRLALAVAVWDGGSLDSDNWSETFNWVGDVIPSPGDDLVFPAVADQFTATNDFAPGTSFGSITFEASYELSGNAITLQSDAGGVDLPLPAYLEAAAGTSSIGFDIFVPPNPVVPPNPIVPPNPVRVADAASLTLAGVVSGDAGLEKSGAGTLVLSAANTFTGQMTVAEGTLSVRHDSALGDSTGDTELLAGTTLELFGGVAIANEPLLLHAAPVDPCRLVSLGGENVWGGSISAPTDPCQFVTLTNLELTGAISGAGDIQKFEDGMLILSAANTFSGQMTVAEGTLSVRNDLALGSTTGGTELLAGTTLELFGGVAIANEPLVLQASPTDPCRLLSLGGDNVWGGSVSTPVDPCRFVTFTNLVLTGAISGAGDIQKFEDGTLIVSAANTFSGQMTVAEGTLSVHHALALGDTTGGTEMLAGTTLELFGGIAIANEPLVLNSQPVDPCRLVSLGGNNVWDGSVSIPTDPCRFVTFTNLELTGPVSGVGDIQKLGDATLVLSGDSPDYTGTIQVQTGTLLVTGSLPAATVEVEGGTFVNQGTLGSLAVHGTTANDIIRIRQANNAGAVEVVVNGASQGSFALTERLIVRAGAGNDIVEAADSVGLSVWLYGDSGHDLLKGGAGHDVLLGGDGFDAVFGGGGRDLIIGGRDSDLLLGNADDDLLIAGTTAFDNQDTALLAILAEWTSSRNYQTRVENIRGTGSGSSFDNRLNGDFFLNAGGPFRTVFDDGAIDVLSGNSGRDWFFANTGGANRDLITDRAQNEFADDVDV